MFKYKYTFFFGAFICLIFAFCTPSTKETLTIRFSNDSAKILIYGIEEAGLYQLKKNIKTDTAYQKIVAVLQTPSENDSTTIEAEIPGQLNIIGDSLLFTPHKSFEKGTTYFVETILNTQFASGKDIIKADVGFHVKKHVKTLKR